MKKIKIIFMVCLITILTGCGSSSVSGRYETIDGVVLELYDNGNCYYQTEYMEYDNCSYNVSSNNQIRLEYSHYNVIYEREETNHKTLDILENGNLEDRIEILYKK